MNTTFSSEYAQKVLRGLGGKENIKFIDNCITRLRVVLKDTNLVDKELLINETGAKKIEQKEQETHIIYGLKIVDIRKALDTELKKENEELEYYINSKKILEYIGGKENIKEIGNCLTRLRLVLEKPENINEEMLIKETGAVKVFKDGNNIQIVYGLKIDEIRKAVESEMNK